MDVIITDHAYIRGNERLSLTKEPFKKMAKKALTEGIKHSETKGLLKRYINNLWHNYKTANNIRIFGEVFFIFNDNILITVYLVPSEFKKYLKIKTRNKTK